MDTINKISVNGTEYGIENTEVVKTGNLLEVGKSSDIINTRINSRTLSMGSNVTFEPSGHTLKVKTLHQTLIGTTPFYNGVNVNDRDVRVFTNKNDYDIISSELIVGTKFITLNVGGPNYNGNFVEIADRAITGTLNDANTRFEIHATDNPSMLLSLGTESETPVFKFDADKSKATIKVNNHDLTAVRSNEISLYGDKITIVNEPYKEYISIGSKTVIQQQRACATVFDDSISFIRLGSNGGDDRSDTQFNMGKDINMFFSAQDDSSYAGELHFGTDINQDGKKSILIEARNNKTEESSNLIIQSLNTYLKSPTVRIGDGSFEGQVDIKAKDIVCLGSETISLRKNFESGSTQSSGIGIEIDGSIQLSNKLSNTEDETGFITQTNLISIGTKDITINNTSYEDGSYYDNKISLGTGIAFHIKQNLAMSISEKELSMGGTVKINPWLNGLPGANPIFMGGASIYAQSPLVYIGTIAFSSQTHQEVHIGNNLNGQTWLLGKEVRIGHEADGDKPTTKNITMVGEEFAFGTGGAHGTTIGTVLHYKGYSNSLEVLGNIKIQQMNSNSLAYTTLCPYTIGTELYLMITFGTEHGEKSLFLKPDGTFFTNLI